MNIENAQTQVDDWIKEHGVRYFNELTNMAQLTEEVGEVARIIARRYGEQSEKECLLCYVWRTKQVSIYKMLSRRN
jgi:NTP pyrophosphatase (non-canonical NTP hydrolase)